MALFKQNSSVIEERLFNLGDNFGLAVDRMLGNENFVQKY